MIASDRFEEALKEWRTSTKLVMRFKGANVHPDRRHLVAARSSDLEALASGMAVPFLPTWIASISYAAVERVVSSTVALAPALTPDRWGLEPRGSDQQT